MKRNQEESKKRKKQRKVREFENGILRAFDFSGVGFASRIAASMNSASAVHRTLNVIRWEVHASVVPNASASMCDDMYRARVCTCASMWARHTGHENSRIDRARARAVITYSSRAFYIFYVRLCMRFLFTLRTVQIFAIT